MYSYIVSFKLSSFGFCFVFDTQRIKHYTLRVYTVEYNLVHRNVSPSYTGTYLGGGKKKLNKNKI